MKNSTDYCLFLEIQHIFYSKENDWGFSHFLGWNVSTIFKFIEIYLNLNIELYLIKIIALFRILLILRKASSKMTL